MHGSVGSRQPSSPAKGHKSKKEHEPRVPPTTPPNCCRHQLILRSFSQDRIIEILGAQNSQKERKRGGSFRRNSCSDHRHQTIHLNYKLLKTLHADRTHLPARSCRSSVVGVVAPLVAAEQVLRLRVAEGAAADDVDEDERDGGGEQRHAGPAPLLPERPQHAGLAGGAAVAELPRVVAPRRAVRVRARRGARPRRRRHVREPARRRRLAAPGLHNAGSSGDG